ncbi:MAG: AAA family ATPase [Firmicutes bacterium]|nr:AAA family ATPase [Bacillota bacterium]
MELKIKLSNHSDKFAPETMLVLKQVNFIFGKNGTGKTTIADEIQSQMSNDYDVRLFKDFEGIAVNERLDAVALGTENAEIQAKIKKIDIEISKIEETLNPPTDVNVNNLYSTFTKTKNTYNQANRAMEKFYSSSAKIIKNSNNPTIANTSYNMNNFKKEIANAKALSVEKIEEYKNVLRSDKKPAIALFELPKMPLSELIDSTNKILQSTIEQPQYLPDLQSNLEKEVFARQGMKIHNHEVGEKCAFCGNEITAERWETLKYYFNDAVEEFEKIITESLSLIEEAIQKTGKTNLEASKFYSQFTQEINIINMQLREKQEEHKKIFLQLKTALENKRNRPFVAVDTLNIEPPSDFSEIILMIEGLLSRHNRLSQDFANKQAEARDLLRFHEINEMLNNFGYTTENAKLDVLKNDCEKAETAFNNAKNELASKKKERLDLLMQTQDEIQMADKMNESLKNMSVTSFSLELVANDKENQKGQYKIKGNSGKYRSVTQLSKGEKNIISFLYFIFSLDRITDNTKPKIIVLDDPMTSNDDTMQYLMIEKIQQLYQRKRIGNNVFVLLTHNVHFYLNSRPYNPGKDFYKKYGVYNLIYDKQTIIKTIKDKHEDFTSSYQKLWRDLRSVYDYENLSPELMLSLCRRICETYCNFNNEKAEKFYKDNSNAKKLFDVNQHYISDFTTDPSAKTRENIKDILQNLFLANDAEEHFDKMWNYTT